MTTSSGRLYWSCRRGMLELDLILIPFYQHCYASLACQQQQQFEQLLACTDVELYAWLTGRGEPEQAEFQTITQLIRDYADDPARSRTL
jgi:antitoxin CptB